MPQSGKIDGVVILPRKRLDDDRGAILKAWAADEDLASDWLAVGEVYCSMVVGNAVKAWHLHRAMTLRYICVLGKALVGLYDNRPTSHTRGATMRVVLEDHGEGYQMLIVPPGIWNGFRSLTAGPSMILNVPDMPHDPREIERMNPRDVPWAFEWGDFGYGG